MNFQFGDLPYGYNPYSSGMTTMGGAYSDTPVWNLADPQVQSQMTEPLFANMNSWNSFGMRNPNIFATNNNSAGFYNNLLQMQYAQNQMLASNSASSLMNIFSNNGKIKELEEIKELKSSKNKSDIFVEDDDEEIKGTKEETESEAEIFKFKSDKPLVGLTAFIKNENDESTFKYGDFDTYAAKTFDALKKSQADNFISLNKFFETYGIDKDDISGKDMKALKAEILKDTTSTTNGEDINLSSESYKKLLNKLGIDDENTSITRGDLKKNIKELIGIQSADDGDDAEPIDNKKSKTYKLTSKSTPEQIDQCAKQLAFILTEANQSALGQDFVLDLQIDDPQIKKQLLEKVQAELKDSKYNVANFNRHYGTSIEEVGMLFHILDNADGKEDIGVKIDKDTLNAFAKAKQQTWMPFFANNVHINFKDKLYSIDYTSFSGTDGYRVYDKEDKVEQNYTDRWDADNVMYRPESD